MEPIKHNRGELFASRLLCLLRGPTEVSAEE